MLRHGGGEIALTVVEEWVRTASPSEIGPGAENPVAPTAPIAPTAPPSNASQAEKDAYARQLTQYNLDLADYRVKQQNYEADARNYNEQGRLARLINSVARVSSGFEHRMRGYNEAGHIVVEQGFSENGNVKFRSHNDAIDKAGNVLRYRTDSFAGEHATSTYTNSYVVGANGTALSGTTGQMLIRTGELAGKYGSMASTTLRYDGNGSLFDVNYLPHEVKWRAINHAANIFIPTRRDASYCGAPHFHRISVQISIIRFPQD